MLVTWLKLTGVRGVETAEFTFGPGLNLLAGLNGAGKSTALDALSVCLNQVSNRVNGLRGTTARFTAEDINVSSDALTVEMAVEIGGSPYVYLHHQPRDRVAVRAADSGRRQAVDTPRVSRFIDGRPQVTNTDAAQHPIALFFSTRRSLTSGAAPSKSVAVGGYQAAFADSFSHRELRLGEFAAWLQAQTVLAREAPGGATDSLMAFEQAIRRFLPGYHDIRVTDEDRPRLLIRKNDTELPVGQLSDGERGILALVFDLTRRLAQANQGVPDPASTGRGVVLIDEIDLHLHPRWQRDIVSRLTETFPNLQFITTTHSPVVIGEVPPERIQIMGYGPVFSPLRSFGKDSSRVLEEVMDMEPRNHKVQQVLRDLDDHLSAEDLDGARRVTGQLSEILGPDDPEVQHASSLLDFLADDE